jgi:hypothetical protein
LFIGHVVRRRVECSFGDHVNQRSIRENNGKWSLPGAGGRKGEDESFQDHEKWKKELPCGKEKRRCE